MHAVPPRIGLMLVVLATLFWGTSAVVARILMRENITPILLGQVMATGVAVLLFVIIGVVRPSVLRITGRDALRLAILGGVGFAGGGTMINFAIHRTNVPTAVVLQYMAPALVLMWNAWRGVERLTAKRVLAVVVCIVGCALTIGIQNGGLMFEPIGILAAFAAAGSFAFVSVFSKPISERHNPLAVSAYTFGFSALALACTPEGRSWAPAFRSTDIVLGMAVYTTALSLLPTMLFFWSLKSVSATVATIVCSFEIVVVAVLSWAKLGEVMTASQAVGAALVISAIVLIEMARLDDARHAALQGEAVT